MNENEITVRTIELLCYEILDIIEFYDLMMATPSCNTCVRARECEVVPAPGEQVRYNCHLWEGEA